VSGPLAGRVALVTGGARNIGRAIALALAAEGAAVAVNTRRSAEAARAVADEINAAGGRAIAVLADVTDRAAVETMLGEIRAALGPLDILVNNAAVRDEAPFEALSYAAWRDAFAATLDGAFHVTQAGLPDLLRSEAASVINIGGLTGHTGAPNRAHVVAAKAALAGFTRALAHEFSPRGVMVNCVVPGLIATERAGGAPAHRAGRTTLAGRQGAPDDIAAAVTWLAGPGGRYVTGQSIHVNGGLLMAG
jgi:3-oxoacyl-[acyl-carrier protein] reductase